MNTQKLEYKYNIKEKSYKLITEELKQRVTLKSQRIKQYESRVE